ncbi:MAG TPA: 4'-phosphopantetheinyl transferase superfamily protein [Vicinamibacterales bacterium]|nr:4'-phosphopantetheinyl transferase superfamily protein [Vicinamibacterales bacterium]
MHSPPEIPPFGARTLGDDEVAVWVCRTDALSAEQLHALDRFLDSSEQSRRDRLRFDRDRRDFSAAHGLLRAALSVYGAVDPSGWRFEVTSHGKPSIVPSQAGTPPLLFNISHTHEFVACAITRHAAVGIDVERYSRVAAAPDIATRHFAAAEVALLEACSADEYKARFIELWTLKESYIKAIGIGLSLALDSFAFALDDAHCLRFVPHDGGSGWQFWLAAALPDVRLSVAIRRERNAPRHRVSFHDWNGPGPSGIHLLRSL